MTPRHAVLRLLHSQESPLSSLTNKHDGHFQVLILHELQLWEIYSCLHFWDASFNRHLLSAHSKADSGLGSREPRDESEEVPRLWELALHLGSTGAKCYSRRLSKAPLENERSRYLCLASWEKFHKSWAEF